MGARTPEPYMALDARTLYRSPSGRLCRYVPAVDREAALVRATFVYVEKASDPAHRWLDGFSLSWRNWRLMKVVGG